MTIRTVLVAACAAIAATGCRGKVEPKKARCERALQHAAMLFTLPGESHEDEATRYAARVTQCQSWPDELIVCLDELDMRSDKCKAAFAKFVMQGGYDAAAAGGDKSKGSAKPKLPDGPNPDWVADLPGEVSAAAVVPGVGIVVTGESGVSFVKDGKVAWTRGLEGGEPHPWIVALQSCAVVAHGPDVSCLALVDGAVMWKTTIPRPPGGDPADDPPVAAAAARTNDGGVALATDDGRVIVIDPAACVASRPACLAASPPLPYKDPEPSLHVLADGRRVVAIGTHLVITDTGGKPLQILDTKDDLGDPSVAADGTLVVAHDDTLVRVDLTKCPASPTPSPASPIGACETVLARVKDLDGFAPALADGGKDALLAITGEVQRTRAGGDPAWKAAIGAVSGLVTIGDAVYAVCSAEASDGDLDDHPPDLDALDAATGKGRWRLHLPLAKLGQLDTPRLLADGATLYVIAGKQALHITTK